MAKYMFFQAGAQNMPSKVHLHHRWQTQGLRAESGPPPCFYPEAAGSSLPLVKEQLHLYSPKITLGPLKAIARLMWSPVKMSLTPLTYVLDQDGRINK